MSVRVGVNVRVAVSGNALVGVEDGVRAGVSIFVG